MKILITGSRGYIGGRLKKELSKKHKVNGLDIDLSADTYHEINGDITNENIVLDAINTFSPDIVLHLASLARRSACSTDPVKAFKSNAYGTMNIALASLKNKAHLIHFSTCDVYGNQPDTIIHEDTAPLPINALGKTKLLGEQIVRYLGEHGLSYNIIRPFSVYGDDENINKHPSVIYILAHKLFNKEKVKIYKDNCRPWMFIDDFVRYITSFVNICQQHNKLILNLTHPNNEFLLEAIADFICHKLNIDKKDFIEIINETPNDVCKTFIVDSKFQAELILNYYCPLDNGIDKVIKSIQNDYS